MALTKPPGLLRTVVHNGWIVTDTAVYLGLGLAMAAWTIVGGRIGDVLQLPRTRARADFD